MKTLAIIPARGGSKGIPRKNIVPLCGKPLIAYTIESALASEYIDKVTVSTDCDEIAKIAVGLGSELIKRPAELATDKAPAILTVLHVIESMKDTFDAVVLLQPTSPLRTAKHIDEAIKLFTETGQDVCSISPVSDHPLLIRKLGADFKLEHLVQLNSTVRRQDMKQYFRVNGAIYINELSMLNAETSMNDNTIGYEMQWEYGLDVDEFKDLALAEWALGGCTS